MLSAPHRGWVVPPSDPPTEPLMVTLNWGSHDFTPSSEDPKRCQCGYGKHNQTHRTPWGNPPKVHSLDIPDEPPTFSVVIDRSHRAWQRVPAPTPKASPRWQVVPAHPLVLENGSSLPWSELLRKHGPLTEVFRIDEAGVAS